MKRLAMSILGTALCAALMLPVAASAVTTGGITGKVTSSATGAPLASLEVCAYTASVEVSEGCSYTGPTGEYKIESLPPGTYKVEFYGSGSYPVEYVTQWYNGQSGFATANPITITEGATITGVNAAMVERGGKIAGTVTDAGNGMPIAGIEVCAANAAYSSFYFFEYCEKTNGSGQYTLANLQSGSYRVQFSSPYKYNEVTGESELEGPNYVTQYYTGKIHAEEGDLIGVVEGTTTSGINAALQAGATITGTVTDAVTGAPLRGVDACAWGASNFYCRTTNASGQYAIQTVPAGTYKVEFEPERFYVPYVPGQPEKEHWQRSEYALAEYTTQYWNDKFTFAAAEPIAAVAGAATAEINAKLTKQTEPAPPPGVAQLKSKKVKVTGSQALIDLGCIGTGPCKGNVALTAKVKAKGKKKVTTATVGNGSFGFLPGTTAIVAIKLTGTGKSLVAKAAKKGLKVQVTGTGLTAGMLTLVGPSKPHKKKAHKPRKSGKSGGKKPKQKK